jgi:thioredoxin 1
MINIINVDDLSFDREVSQSEVPVLVEFGAEWCGPCKKQLPILQKISEDYFDKVKVVKVDIDESPSLSYKFGIRSVPTMFVFKKGVKVSSRAGLSSVDDLKSLILDEVK